MPHISKEEFITLQQDLITDAAISRYLKISRQRVHQIRLALGLPSSRENNQARNAQIIAMYKSGSSMKEIATKFNLHEMGIYYICSKAGVVIKANKNMDHDIKPASTYHHGLEWQNA
jgi:hypothetical protein